jgi:hypothetical protein
LCALAYSAESMKGARTILKLDYATFTYGYFLFLSDYLRIAYGNLVKLTHK